MDIGVQVENQFCFSPTTQTACVAISIIAIYHQYENRERLLTNAEWRVVMERGGTLWRLWKNAHPNAGSFPTAAELLQLKQCEPFVRVFGDAPREYAGLVHDSEGCDNPEGTLTVMLRAMVETVQTRALDCCCLLILPNAISISMLCLSHGGAGAYEIRYFDSHGRLDNDYCDFAVLYNYRDALTHIFARHTIQRYSPPQRPGDGTYGDVEAVQRRYGYSAILFIPR